MLVSDPLLVAMCMGTDCRILQRDANLWTFEIGRFILGRDTCHTKGVEQAPGAWASRGVRGHAPPPPQKKNPPGIFLILPSKTAISCIFRGFFQLQTLLAERLSNQTVSYMGILMKIFSL